MSDISRLTADLAAEYAKKTPKTVTRDINILRDAGLLTRNGSSVRPNLDQLFAFLPLRKEPS
jgi:hypothetical protein